jgi:hypothetical protein
VTLAGDKLGDKIPDCDMTDPAALESFYGNYSFFEHYRKCVLSNCREIVRATVGVSTKLTVDRVDDLARTHPLYLDFLATHLHGRRLREKNVLDSNAYSR